MFHNTKKFEKICNMGHRSTQRQKLWNNNEVSKDLHSTVRIIVRKKNYVSLYSLHPLYQFHSSRIIYDLISTVFDAISRVLLILLILKTKNSLKSLHTILILLLTIYPNSLHCCLKYLDSLNFVYSLKTSIL